MAMHACPDSKTAAGGSSKESSIQRIVVLESLVGEPVAEGAV